MLRKLIAAAAIAVLPVGLARAQVADIRTGLPASAYGWNAYPIYGHSRTPEQAGREFEIERNYREAVKKIPDKKGSNDPWRTIRPAAAASAVDRHRPE
jgi:hypothetical protein